MKLFFGGESLFQEGKEKENISSPESEECLGADREQCCTHRKGH